MLDTGEREGMNVALHDDHFESPLKEMPHPMVPTVVALRVDVVQLPHALGQISPGSLDKEVVVMGHQTVGMAEPSMVRDVDRDVSRPTPPPRPYANPEAGTRGTRNPRRPIGPYSLGFAFSADSTWVGNSSRRFRGSFPSCL